MTIKQIYRIILAFIGLLGITLQILKDGFGMLLYYTVLSNLLVLIFLLYLIYREYYSIKTTTLFLRIKGGITMAIAITFIVYHFLLSPYVSSTDYWNLKNFIVHYIVPLGFILDTLYFDDNPRYKVLDPIIWTTIPLSYFALSLCNGLLFKLPIPGSPDSPYPYYFININKYGVNGVIKNSAFIFFGYLIFGYILIVVKSIISKLKKDKTIF